MRTAPKLPNFLEDEQNRNAAGAGFEDVPLTPGSTAVYCAACHSGAMLNQTNRFIPLPVLEGSRFQNVLVSEFNTAGNPEREFIFRNPDGSTQVIRSADPGRALITGNVSDVNVFKIPSLSGIRRTAPYFQDNSAKTLEDC